MAVAIVDERISDACERRLTLLGFKVIKCPPSKRLSEAVASHPDMLMLAHGSHIITSADFCEEAPCLFLDIRENTDKVNLTFTEDVFSPKYPNDVLFNALIVGKKIFVKTDSISSAVLEYAKNAELEIIHTSQGYPACTALALKKSVISSDRGLAKTLSENGIPVTLISNGDISLPPHEYGFIGGASGVFGDTVYFLGNINTHRDSEIIKKQISKEGMNYISLSDEPLRDLGRIVFVG